MTDSIYFVKSAALKNFHWIFSTFYRYVTDILETCIKKFLCLLVCVGVLLPSQQRGHVEPVS